MNLGILCEFIVEKRRYRRVGQICHGDADGAGRQVDHGGGPKKKSLAHGDQQLIEGDGGGAVIEGIMYSRILQIPELKIPYGALSGFGIQDELLPIQLAHGHHGPVGKAVAPGHGHELDGGGHLLCPGDG